MYFRVPARFAPMSMATCSLPCAVRLSTSAAAARNDDGTMSGRDQGAADFERAQLHSAGVEGRKQLHDGEAASLHGPSSAGQRVLRAAVRALGRAIGFDRQVHFGVPEFHNVMPGIGQDRGRSARVTV